MEHHKDNVTLKKSIFYPHRPEQPQLQHLQQPHKSPENATQEPAKASPPVQWLHSEQLALKGL